MAHGYGFYIFVAALIFVSVMFSIFTAAALAVIVWDMVKTAYEIWKSNESTKDRITLSVLFGAVMFSLLMAVMTVIAHVVFGH